MYIADNAKCNIIIVENDHQLQKILKVWHQLPDLKAVIQYKDTPAKNPNVYSVCISVCVFNFKALYVAVKRILYGFFLELSSD